MRALVYDGSLRGHRANYVGLLVRELLGLGVEVALSCPGPALESCEAKTFLGDLLNEIEVFPLELENTTGSTLAKARTRLHQLRSVARSSQAETVYVPYADGMAQAWGMTLRSRSMMPRDVIFEGLMMRGTYAYPAASRKVQLLSKLALMAQRRSPWDRLHHLDAVAFHRLGANGTESRDRLIPEAIDPPRMISREEARRILGVEPGENLVTCPGGVSKTKGSDRLVRAMARLPESVDGKLLLLGRHAPEVRSVIKEVNRPDRIVSLDRFASPMEFDCLFAAADLLALCYPRHIGSASILLRAAAYRRHIIASDWGWLGWATREFEIGQLTDCGSVDSIAATLAEVLPGVAGGEKPESSDKLSRWLAYHTPQNHTAHWVQGICDRMARPAPELIPHPDVQDWSVRTDAERIGRTG